MREIVAKENDVRPTALHECISMNGASSISNHEESPPQTNVQRPGNITDESSSTDEAVPIQPRIHHNLHVPEKHENTAIRVFLRTLAYFVYDGIKLKSERNEISRVGKALVELVVDERFPPPHRSEMPLSRKCKEFLLPPAVSSLAWFVVIRLRYASRRASSGKTAGTAPLFWAKASWTVLHRIARQALIHRLFFRIGSIRYSLASALGIVCCFFKDSIFREIYRLGKWPKHFSSSQGLAALFRSLLYALSFSLPVQRMSKLLQESPRRRGNVKKIIFAVILSQVTRLNQLKRLLAHGELRTI